MRASVTATERIAAAAATFCEQEGVANDYARHTAAPRYIESARASLDPLVLARIEAEGRTMSVRHAVSLALDVGRGSTSLSPTSPSTRAGAPDGGATPARADSRR